MKKLLMIFAVVLTTGCVSQWSSEQRNFERFNDIPIPEHSFMDKRETAIIGEDANWWGVLKFSISNKVPVLFDYYSKEMKRFGWKNLTFLKGDASNNSIIFSKNKRIAQISFLAHPIEGTQVKIIMSPRTKGEK